MSERIYNYQFQKKDERDFKFSATIPSSINLPSSIDLSKNCPPVYDQLSIGSCTSQATAACIFTRRKIENIEEIHPSRLWIYYQARFLENTIKQDSGATIRDVIKGVAKFGYCKEETLPYDISKFKKKPSKKCYSEALPNIISKYEAVSQNLNDIKTCLFQEHTIVIGISVYESFESVEVSKTGIVPIPKDGENNLGGHAILIVGYDDDKKCFKFRNSWGESWGDKGYGYIPYNYLTNPNLAGDFWKISLI